MSNRRFKKGTFFPENPFLFSYEMVTLFLEQPELRRKRFGSKFKHAQTLKEIFFFEI